MGGELAWMGVRGFHYYIHSFLGYLESDYADGDSDAVNVFLGLVADKESNWDVIKPVLVPIIRTLDHVIDRYEKYSIKGKIYGDLPAKAEMIRANLRKKL